MFGKILQQKYRKYVNVSIKITSAVDFFAISGVLRYQASTVIRILKSTFHGFINLSSLRILIRIY